MRLRRSAPCQKQRRIARRPPAPAARGGFDVLDRGDDRQEHQHRAGQVRLGFVRHVDDDRHHRICHRGEHRDDAILRELFREPEDRPYTSQRPRDNIQSRDDVKPGKCVRMIEIKCDIGAEINQMQPGAEFQKDADGVNPESAVLVETRIAVGFGEGKSARKVIISSGW